jgi:MarR family transcriptional regulator, organic hydroperoxide resistance regulator
MPEWTGAADPRVRLERRMGADLRELTSESDWIARVFADQNHVSANEFRALLFVMLAESNGVHLTAGDLRRQMGLSGAAITYLVERMAETGHLRRETDPSDRRKVILRYADHGMSVATKFFTRLGEHNHRAMAHLPDSDLEAADRVFGAMISAMQTFRADMAATARRDAANSG